MRTVLVSAALVATFLVLPRTGAAQVPAAVDAGGTTLFPAADAGVDPDAAAVVDAGLVDAVPQPIACDGGLCETQVGTACEVASGAPGRRSRLPLALSATVGALALATLWRTRDRGRRRRVPGPDSLARGFPDDPSSPDGGGASRPPGRSPLGSHAPAGRSRR